MRRFESAAAALCCTVTAVIACIVLFAYGTTAFYLKAHTGEFLLGNVGLLAIALAAFAGLAAFSIRFRRQIARLGWKLPAALSALLLCAQVFITYHAYFFSVWDARYVLEGAWAFAYDMPDMIAANYFEMYPNNLALVGLFGSLLRLPMYFGMELSQERGVLLMILVQCLLNTACGALVWAATRRAAQGKYAHAAALMAWIAYAALIGTSPWVLVPYSDGMGLIFPVLLLFIYQRAQGRLPSAVLIGALGAAAYLIKPQACIPLIAIAICEAVSVIAGRSGRAAAYLALLVASFVLVCMPAQGWVERELGIELDDEGAVSPAHYLNMGLNDEHDGAFYTPDLEAAMAIEGSGERMRWCMQSAADRIRAYGFSGLMGHMLRKALINFSDGGFAWGVDFARNELPLKDGTVSVFVRSVFYEDGALYPLLHTFEQAVWLLLLVLCPIGACGLAWTGQERSRPANAAAMLSVIGIVAFNMLFEAKARYVYVMTPVMIVAAMAGIAAWIARMRAAAE